MAERTFNWVVCEMNENMRNDVEIMINKAMDQKGDTEKDISEYIKKYFDQKYGPIWHCCVGKHYPSYLTYQSKNYMFLYIG